MYFVSVYFYVSNFTFLPVLKINLIFDYKRKIVIVVLFKAPIIMLILLAMLQNGLCTICYMLYGITDVSRNGLTAPEAIASASPVFWQLEADNWGKREQYLFIQAHKYLSSFTLSLKICASHHSHTEPYFRLCSNPELTYLSYLFNSSKILPEKRCSTRGNYIGFCWSTRDIKSLLLRIYCMFYGKLYYKLESKTM